MAKYHSNPQEDIKKGLKPSEAELEYKKMKKEIKDLQEENEILKKAASFFAKNQKLLSDSCLFRLIESGLRS